MGMAILWLKVLWLLENNIIYAVVNGVPPGPLARGAEKRRQSKSHPAQKTNEYKLSSVDARSKEKKRRKLQQYIKHQDNCFLMSISREKRKRKREQE